MPVLGGLKAESGRVGRDLGPLLRAPTPGEMGGVLRGGVVRVAIIARWDVGTASKAQIAVLKDSHVRLLAHLLPSVRVVQGNTR
jgi:hypothetical protein